MSARGQAPGRGTISTTAVTARSPSTVCAVTSRWPCVALTQPVTFRTGRERPRHPDRCRPIRTVAGRSRCPPTGLAAATPDYRLIVDQHPGDLRPALAGSVRPLAAVLSHQSAADRPGPVGRCGIDRQPRDVRRGDAERHGQRIGIVERPGAQHRALQCQIGAAGVRRRAAGGRAATEHGDRHLGSAGPGRGQLQSRCRADGGGVVAVASGSGAPESCPTRQIRSVTPSVPRRPPVGGDGPDVPSGDEARADAPGVDAPEEDASGDGEAEAPAPEWTTRPGSAR